MSEAVIIRLRKSTGLTRRSGYFVQCNQVDCQYVEENKPPCPLTVAMFAEELAAIEMAQEIRLAAEGGSPPVDEGVTR